MTLAANMTGPAADVDMMTGLPRYSEEELQGFEVGERMLPWLESARKGAADTLIALMDPRMAPVLEAWINQLVGRVEVLMKEDPFCVAIMAGFAELGYKLNYAEIVVKNEIRRIAGPNFPIPQSEG